MYPFKDMQMLIFNLDNLSSIIKQSKQPPGGGALKFLRSNKTQKTSFNHPKTFRQMTDSNNEAP